jgi:hypothetical protein
MEVFIGMVIGCAAGAFATVVIFTRCCSGILKMITSAENERPYLFLELWEDTDAILKNKYVILKTEIRNDISHE